MKAYAVCLEGHYWLVYAPTAAQAKGRIITAARSACGQAHVQRIFGSLRCRRWQALDKETDTVSVSAWGFPGERDYETGLRIAMPDPFAGRER